MDFSKGIIILDKPCDHISHEITTLVKKITGSNKSGHAGTLDPKVSGVLPIALGKDTKMLRFIAGEDKTYIGIIKFKEEISEQKVRELFKKFTGEISQIPPKKSAVKKVRRTRNVYSLKLLGFKGKLFLFEARVSAGTYIRTLCVDIGKSIGIPARMEELRRVAVGRISENECVTMQELIDAIWILRNKNDDSLIKKIIHPIDQYLHFKKIIIKENAAKELRNGAQLMAPGLVEVPIGLKPTELTSIYSESGELVGIGISFYSSEEMKKINNGQVVKIERIY